MIDKIITYLVGNSMNSKIDDRIDNRTTKPIERLQQTTDKLQDKIENLTGDVRELRGIYKGWADKQSPLSLTEKGTDVLNKSGAQSYLNDNFEKLYEYFEDVDKEYDIQEKAKDVIASMDTDIENKLKDGLYKSGASVGDIALIMSLRLRDMVIDKRKHTTK